MSITLSSFLGDRDGVSCTLDPCEARNWYEERYFVHITLLIVVFEKCFVYPHRIIDLERTKRLLQIPLA